MCLLPTSGALRALFLILLFSVSSIFGQDKDWRPVSPEDLQSKTPVVEPDADAEAIFWETRIDDSSDDLSLRHYVRVKIYTERGRERYSKFDVPYTRGLKIKELAARVIRPDGTIVEIGKQDVFDREIIKAGGVKVKAKSFAVPNIEPGVIVEYKYKETYDDAGASGMRLQFQRDIPIRNLSYYYKPYNSKEPHYQGYNLTDTKFVKDQGGYWLARRNNVPSFKEEPRMPPEDSVKPWMLLTSVGIALTDVSDFSISFVVKDQTNPKLYWGGVSAQKAGLVKFMNKPSGDIKKAAADITAGATTDNEKLRKLYEFCQKEIKNTTFDASLTDEDRKKLPQTKSMSDVLKRKSGSSQFVDMLFGALASAAGFDARVALTADRSKMFFVPEMANEKLVHPAAIAIRDGERFRFFNPGVPFLAFGQLVWYEEDVWALILGENNFYWQKTPLTSYKDSNEKRTGKFRLLEDGTLEGTVQVEYSGQPAIAYRVDNYDETPAKLEDSLRNELKERVSGGEVSEVVVENVTDISKPLLQRYKIRVPGYAQKTGKRLFLQPGFFEYGVDPLFSSSTRRYDICFKYPWSENDSIEIELPRGYLLDSADTPGQMSDPEKIASTDITMAWDKTANILKYSRAFHFGGGGNIVFPKSAYAPLKQLFDAFSKADTHTITLRQTEVKGQ